MPAVPDRSATEKQPQGRTPKQQTQADKGSFRRLLKTPPGLFRWNNPALPTLPPAPHLRLNLTEHRGITLQQIKALENEINACADKNGCLPGWVDKDGKTCTVDTVNLYDVVKYLVNPKTAMMNCSYVELVAPEATRVQTPEWFVSHWWGEPVKDFIACLVEHARVRRLGDKEAVYWVSGLARRVHVNDLGVSVVHVNAFTVLVLFYIVLHIKRQLTYKLIYAYMRFTRNLN